VVQGKNVTRLSDREAATFRKQNYGFVFQQAMLIDGLNTLENVLLSVGVQGARPTSKIKDRAVEILQLLGLGDALHAQPAILSGGQKQRVSIARALVKDPPIVLCDEPTSALDAESGQVVLDFLKKIALEEKKVVVVVSHDARVFPFADRLIKLEEGRIVSDTREPY
ncbi:ATP-binding cassette domain-containing protein, partial [Candidatus Parcubacteria bacterium]